MIDVTQPPFNANPNGTTDNNLALTNAINAANAGDELYFPPGVYFLNKPVQISNAKSIKVYGRGATILTQGGTQGIPDSGIGGGFLFVNCENLIIDGLIFQGYYTYDYPGHLLSIIGHYNTIQNCTFKNGFGGAILIRGNNNTVLNNLFEECNFFDSNNADLGAIHIYAEIDSSQTPAVEYPSRHNNIFFNRIVNHRYAGISANGKNNSGLLSHLDIIGNYIKSISANKSEDNSMGVYLFGGANNNIKICNNTIENADAEGIVIFSTGSCRGKNGIIEGNTIKHACFQGISLNWEGASGGFEDYIIANNLIENDQNSSTYDSGIFLNGVSKSILSGNRLIGVNGSTEEQQVGINMTNSCMDIQIHNNNLSGQNQGIRFYATRGICSNNIVQDCITGIVIGYSSKSNIQNNIVSSTREGSLAFMFHSSVSEVNFQSNTSLCLTAYGGTSFPPTGLFENNYVS